ncbi:uncharacterized protein LOC143301615 [Babylonia areolata]|uniref:uncharacterized protein LOC143301615 n=1 Tax=Babylonia areolata TaxID=304850 RepID=UPI003FCFA0EE
MKTLALLTILVLTCMLVTDTEAGWRIRWRRLGRAAATTATVWAFAGKRSADGCPFARDFRNTGNALLVKFNLQCPQHGLVAKDAVLAAYDASNKDGNTLLDKCELSYFHDLVEAYDECAEDKAAKRG